MPSPAYARFQNVFRRWRLAAAILWCLYGALQLAFAALLAAFPGLAGGRAAEAGSVLALVFQGILGAGLLASGLLLLAGRRQAVFGGLACGGCAALWVFAQSIDLLDRHGRGEKAALGFFLLRMALPLLTLHCGIMLALYLRTDRQFRRQPFADVTLGPGEGQAGRQLAFTCPHCGVGLTAGTLRPADLILCPACAKGFTGGVALRAEAAPRVGGLGCLCEQVTRTETGLAAAPTIADVTVVRRWDISFRSPGGRQRVECPYCTQALEVEFRAGAPGETDGRVRSDPGAAPTPERPALVDLVRGYGGKKEVFFVRHRVAPSDEAAPASAARRPAHAPPPPTVDRVCCPACRAELRVPAYSAGKAFRCPRCRGPVTAPGGRSGHSG